MLIARENLLYTFIDYYKDKFNHIPSIELQQEFAEIISWNIFQMDGLKYVIPMSCHHEIKIIPGKLTLFEEMADTVEKYECEAVNSIVPLNTMVNMYELWTGEPINH